MFENGSLFLLGKSYGDFVNDEIEFSEMDVNAFDQLHVREGLLSDALPVGLGISARGRRLLRTVHEADRILDAVAVHDLGSV